MPAAESKQDSFFHFIEEAGHQQRTATWWAQGQEGKPRAAPGLAWRTHGQAASPTNSDKTERVIRAFCFDPGSTCVIVSTWEPQKRLINQLCIPAAGSKAFVGAGERDAKCSPADGPAGGREAAVTEGPG